MNAAQQIALRVLEVTASDHCEDVWWRMSNDQTAIAMLVICNDLFFWGSSDCEEVTEGNIAILEQAYQDSPEHGAALFCCRVRCMRPQGVYYAYLSESEKPLFDACGPVREVGPGNPRAQDEEWLLNLSIRPHVHKWSEDSGGAGDGTG